MDHMSQSTAASLFETTIQSDEAESLRITEIQAARGGIVVEVPNSRRFIGSGAFGQVYATVDRQTLQPLAVKVTRIGNDLFSRQKKTLIYREISALKQLKHHNIIPYLGHAGLDTDEVAIYMPLRQGNLTSLAKSRTIPNAELRIQAMHQMLKALDFLAAHNQCHRDVKPDNILYAMRTDGTCLLQLADFGLVQHTTQALTFVGTPLFRSPEMFRTFGRCQSPKMDVWALCVTILAIHEKVNWSPFPGFDYVTHVLPAIRRSVLLLPSEWAAMAREDPNHRPSAAQCLIEFFNDKASLTTKGRIPPFPSAPMPNRTWQSRAPTAR